MRNGISLILGIIMEKKWSKDSFQKQLSQFRYSGAYSCLQGIKKAGVLIPIVLIEGMLYVWLTLRASTLRNDAGHVAFPGGLEDPEDEDLQATCLREAYEEIGLESDNVEIVAQIVPYINRRNILLVPFVGIVSEDFKPNINEDEVESAFLLPLERFLSNENHQCQQFNFRESKWLSHHFDDCIENKLYHTWGLTAHICIDFAIAIFQRAPNYEWNSSGENTIEDPFIKQKKNIKTFIESIKENKYAESKL